MIELRSRKLCAMVFNGVQINPGTYKYSANDILKVKDHPDFKYLFGEGDFYSKDLKSLTDSAVKKAAKGSEQEVTTTDDPDAPALG